MTNLGPAVSLLHLLPMAVRSPIFRISVPCPCSPLAAFGYPCLPLSVHHWNLLDQNTHPAFLLILLFPSSSSLSSSPNRRTLGPLRPSLPSAINGTSHFSTWNDLEKSLRINNVKHHQANLQNCRTTVFLLQVWEEEAKALATGRCATCLKIALRVRPLRGLQRGGRG